jgi:hypothetical protein
MMNNDAEGRLYDRPASERSSTNKLNAKLAKEYMDLRSQEEKKSIYGQAREEGIREGADSAYMDVMQRLEASNQYRPIQEGSPEDIYMQDGVDRGLNYVAPNEPGLLDAIGNRLKETASSAAEWFTQGVEQAPSEAQLQRQKDMQFEQMQYESEQAGLAELKEILRNKQR